MSISFTVTGAVAATGIGENRIREAIHMGDLVAHYVGKKAILRAADLDDWIKSLPEVPS